MPVRLAVQSKLSSSLPYTEVQPSASNFSALRRVCAFTLSVDVLVRVDANMGLRPVDDHLGRVHICDFGPLARRAVGCDSLRQSRERESCESQCRRTAPFSRDLLEHGVITSETFPPLALAASFRRRRCTARR